MMTRNRVIALLVVFLTMTLVLITMITACGLSSQQEKITIRIAEKSPSIGVRAEGIEFFIEMVEERCGDSIEFEVYYGSSLLEETEFITGTQAGTADICFIDPKKFPQQLPVWQALTTIMIGPRDKEVNTQLYFDIIDEIPEFGEDFANWNLKAIGLHQQRGLTLFLTQPIDNIEQIGGRKIRTVGSSLMTYLEAMGATSLYLPINDCYMAMQRGTIDGVFTYIEPGFRFNFQEVSKYIYPCLEAWTGTPDLMVINSDTWNKLDSTCQEAITDAAMEMSLYFAELVENGIDEMISSGREAGCLVELITAEDFATWSQKAEIQNLPEEWVTTSGIDNAGEIMDKLMEMIVEAMQ